MKRRGWMLAASCRSWSLVVMLAAGPTAAAAQLSGVRFEITQVSDSTFGFPRGTAGWVKAGLTGIAVDPRRRDVLVARFRVVSVDTGFVTALITGQTTRVATDHVVVLSEPPRPWWKAPTFWGGALLGLVAGIIGSR